jgi:hypothetical protein
MMDDDKKDAKAAKTKAIKKARVAERLLKARDAQHLLKEINRQTEKWPLQYMVDLVTECEEPLCKAEEAEKKNVTVRREALRFLLQHFWRHPPNKLPLFSEEKARRQRIFIKYRKELDRRVAAGEHYKQVVYKVSLKAAGELSNYTYSLSGGPFMSISEKTAKRYIESLGTRRGQKKRRPDR